MALLPLLLLLVCLTASAAPAPKRPPATALFVLGAGMFRAGAAVEQQLRMTAETLQLKAAARGERRRCDRASGEKGQRGRAAIGKSPDFLMSELGTMNKTEEGTEANNETKGEANNETEGDKKAAWEKKGADDDHVE
ncbi:hypothetical protein EJB05_28788, partial [Eragrostis curvula]